MNGGKEDVSGLNWLKVVRHAYQKALNVNENELITAWARQHLH